MSKRKTNAEISAFCKNFPWARRFLDAQTNLVTSILFAQIDRDFLIRGLRSSGVGLYKVREFLILFDQKGNVLVQVDQKYGVDEKMVWWKRLFGFVPEETVIEAIRRLAPEEREKIHFALSICNGQVTLYECSQEFDLLPAWLKALSSQPA